MTLLPVHVRHDGRPSVLRHEGWWELISLHDRLYLERKAAWKRLLRAAHPDHWPDHPSPRIVLCTFRRRRDGRLYQKRERRVYARCGGVKRGGGHINQRFRGRILDYRAWLRQERWYYWLRGLMPPDWRGVPKPPQGWKGRRARTLLAVVPSCPN